MQVPTALGADLFKMLSHAESEMSRIAWYQVKYVEQSRVQLSRHFNSKIIPKKCDREDCMICIW